MGHGHGGGFFSGLLTGEMLSMPWGWGGYGYGYGYNNPEAEARNRYNNIKDNLGIDPGDLKQYRSQHGGYGILEGIIGGAIGAGVAAIALFAFSTVLMPFAPVIAISAVMTGAFIGIALHESKTVKNYSAYLDQAAAQGRAARDNGRSAPSIEYDNGTPGKSYIADLAAQRQNIGKGDTFAR